MSMSLMQCQDQASQSLKTSFQTQDLLASPSGCWNVLTLAASAIIKQVIARRTDTVVRTRPIHTFVLAEELWEAAFVHVCNGKIQFRVFGFTVKRAVPQAGAIQTMCLSPQLEFGTFQLLRALRQPGKILLNRFLAKPFFFFFSFPRETKAAAQHNAWLLYIYFSFWIPVTSWLCFRFCFTSEIAVLQ